VKSKALSRAFHAAIPEDIMDTLDKEIASEDNV
jgi:predicted RNA-binding protein YlxR (DUF448 family)